MQRAAAGLAYAVIDLLGSAYGRRVLLLVGSGDNGGDALYAGAMLARRGCAVEAWLLSERVHEGGLAALRAAGGRVVCSDGRPGSHLSTRPEVVVDGIVGIGGRPGPAARRGRGAGGASRASRSSRSTSRPGSTSTPASSTAPTSTPTVTVTFGTHKVAHLVDPAAAACGVVHLVDIGLDLPDAARRGAAAARRGPAAAAARPAGAQVHPRGRRGPGRLAAVPRRRAALRGRRGHRAVRDGALRRRRPGRRPGPRGPPRRGRGRPGPGLGGRLRRRGRAPATR